MSASTNELNERFGIEDRLAFREGPGGFQVAELRSDFSRCVVSVYGAHVLEFEDFKAGPVLWLSGSSHWEKGRPVRGGIPVCWPWFGAHPSDKTKPAHGFARTSQEWFVSDSRLRADGSVEIKISLRPSPATEGMWPNKFELDLAVAAGRSLEAALETRNTGGSDFSCNAALHSYFSVGDITRVSVTGLDRRSFIDTTDRDAVRTQSGHVVFQRETDNIYIDTTDACEIHDPSLSRRIRVEKSGSNSTVVWNPWVEKSKRMPDFGDEEYKTMLCVETAKAREDAIFLPPGASHQLKAIISAAKL